MIETIRIVANALEDGTIGVNAKLPGVPLDGTDEQPPDVDEVLNVYDSDEAAQGQSGQEQVTLVVSPDGPTDWEGEVAQVFRGGSQTTAAIRYVTRDADLAKATRHGAYTMRAIRRTIAELMKQSNASLRDRNGIQLTRCTGILDGALQEMREDGTVTGASVVGFSLRDTKP